MEKGRFYIAVDCEGAACAVGSPLAGLGRGENYAFAAKQAAREANAAARALFDMGAQDVLIWDNHGDGVNLDYDLLDERCRIVNGSGFAQRFPRIDESFGGVLFIGYHARAGEKGAVLAHTYASAAYQRVEIDGQAVGEMEIDAAFAGKKGVPVIFAASDDIAAAQAKQAFPWAETVWTKEALSYNGAISLHPQEACRRIEAGVRRAAARLPEMRPYVIKEPFCLTVRYPRPEAAGEARLYDRDGRPFSAPDAHTRKGVVAQIEDLRL